MPTIYLEHNDMLSKLNYKNLITFLSSISTRITYSVLINNYILTFEEYTNAVSDLSDEYSEEDVNRRLRFSKDVEYREFLRKTYHTYDEVLAYFDRLKYYDLIELEEVKKQLLMYINKSNDNTILKIDGLLREMNLNTRRVLPEENYMGSKFTYNSHCTIGGIYKVYCFKMNKNMAEYIISKKNLTKLNTFKEIDLLEDPVFYEEDRLICSICSHERTYTLFLQEKEFVDFQLLKIPFSN